MAAEYYSPYVLMAKTAWLVSIGGVVAMPRTDDEKRRLGWADGIGGLASLVSGIPVLMYSACGDSYKGHEADLRVEEINSQRIRDERKLFYFTYGVGLGWNILTAAQIENSNKWYYVGAVVLAPFVADGINRLVFNRHKLSPYSSWTFNISYDPSGTPIAQLNYQF